MVRKSIILFILLSVPLLSCTTINRQTKIDPPTQSYVKINLGLWIKSCKESFKLGCPSPELRFESMGSGMVIDLIRNETIVLTAGHVCKSQIDHEKIETYEEELSVTDFTGRRHQAYVINDSQDNSIGNIDICALWVPTLKVPGVKISHYPPAVGQELYYIGSPMGVFHPPTAPIFTGIYSGKIDVSNSMVAIPAVGGSSGSVVMDLNNKAVGVLWAAHHFHHISIITNWENTVLFLKQTIDMYMGKNPTINLPLLKN